MIAISRREFLAAAAAIGGLGGLVRFVLADQDGDKEVFTYDYGLLVTKQANLTALISREIQGDPVVGGVSDVIVTTQVLQDENYMQYQRNMGLINRARPYFLENVTYLAVLKGSAQLVGASVEYEEGGRWHAVNPELVKTAYETRDSTAARLIQHFMKGGVDFALGLSNFIQVYNREEVEVQEGVSYYAAPFMEHRDTKSHRIKPLKLRTTYKVRWMRPGEVDLRFLVRSAHNVPDLTPGASKWKPQLVKEYEDRVRVGGGRDSVKYRGVEVIGVRRLTTAVHRGMESSQDNHPSVSPDGRQVIFASSCRDNKFDHLDYYLGFVNADGTGQRVVPFDAEIHFPTWSPDGSRIAFSFFSGPPAGIYIVNSDGSGQRKFADGFSPTWSPDGSRIAFESESEIYVVGTDGGNQRKLTDKKGNYSLQDLQPAWSPDGKYIAFISNRADFKEGSRGIRFHHGDVWIMYSDGNNQKMLPAGKTEGCKFPAWFPDGRHIAYTSQSSRMARGPFGYIRECYLEIFVMDLAYK